MKERSRTCAIGVMGSSNAEEGEAEKEGVKELAERLGAIITSHGCSLVTGATTGLPDLVSRAVRRHGGLTVGISPAISEAEHVSQYKYPIDAADVMIYRGFGLKGRNVINIRSSDIVVIFGGGMGTLNELTIAYDEGKVIGVLEGSGGVANHLREIIGFANKPTNSKLIYATEPEQLIEECLAAWRERCR